MSTKAQEKIEKLLSQRETEVIRLIALGTSRADIATKLEISVLTYDEHRKNIKNKLGLKSNADWARTLTAFF